MHFPAIIIWFMYLAKGVIYLFIFFLNHPFSFLNYVEYYLSKVKNI